MITLDEIDIEEDDEQTELLTRYTIHAVYIVLLRGAGHANTPNLQTYINGKKMTGP